MAKRQQLIAQLRNEAGKVLKAVEDQIALREAELTELRSQLETWRHALGGNAAKATTRNRRPKREGGRVNWDSVLLALPDRFGVNEVLKQPDAARRGRAQVYQAVTRWELAKRIRRVEKGIYEKAEKQTKPVARPARKNERGRAKKRAA